MLPICSVSSVSELHCCHQQESVSTLPCGNTRECLQDCVLQQFRSRIGLVSVACIEATTQNASTAKFDESTETSRLEPKIGLELLFSLPQPALQCLDV